MKHLKIILILSATFFFSGCAFIHSLDENLPQQVDVWMQDKEYGKVIDTLAYIGEEHPHYKRLAPLREVALQKAFEYETYILTRGKQFLDKENWQEAYIVYDQGLAKLPDSAVIQQAMNEFLAQRDTYIRQLSYQIMFNKAQAILANTPIQNNISQAVPDNYRYRTQARQHESERIELSVELLDCAEYSLQANQLVTGQKCLDLAANISGSPVPKRHQKLQSLLSKKRKLLSQVLSQTAEVNLNAAKDHLEHQRLKDAKEHLQKIPVEEQQKPAVIKLQEQLDQQIKLIVKKGAATGRKLYSEGKFKEALEIWQALLILDPDNAALQKHVERAQRVLKKLQSLETRTPATN